MQLLQHPLSAVFPAMSAIEYDALCKSVAEIGILNPIVLFDGMVIDGWHRYRASQDEMMPAPTIELASDIDPQVYVIAQNKDRRHLTQSQVATAAIKVYAWLKNGVNSGLQTASAPSAEAKSSAEIAKIAGVSTRTVEQAKQVDLKATPEIKSAVANGEISLKKAAETLKPIKTYPENGSIEAPIYSDIDRLKDENAELKEIIEGLQYDMSIAAYDGAEPIAEIVRELKIAKASLKQVTISRNSLQNELNSAKKQIMAQRKALDLLK